jgi:hypothetical protein
MENKTCLKPPTSEKWGGVENKGAIAELVAAVFPVLEVMVHLVLRILIHHA